MIEFSDQEKAVILRLSVPGGWADDDAESIKGKIKDHFLGLGVSSCCYCGLSMSTWHRISIDIEHVLPKGRFPQFTFEIKNLNISCKRCNMTIKGEKTSFYLGGPHESDPFKGELYSFIHPNSDNRGDHLRTVMMQVDNDLYIKYVVISGSQKGNETYRFFRLEELEINTFDRAQGAISDVRIDDLPFGVAEELRSILPESGEV